MKKLAIISILLLLSRMAMAQEDFFKFFEDKTLHMSYDVLVEGRDFTFSNVMFDIQNGWSGPLRLSCDDLERAPQRVVVRNTATGNVIYAKAYSSLLEEWISLRKTSDAVNDCNHVVSIPLPRIPVRIDIMRQDSAQGYYTVYSQEFVPNNSKQRDLASLPYPSRKYLSNGDPHKCIDIVILSEGYTRGEMGKFDSICKLFVDYLFKYEPFKSNIGKFNITAVQVPSMRSGITYQNLKVPTFLGFQYGMFDIDRYMGSWSQYLMMLAASGVPCDHIVVFGNAKNYGGGGIYNQYAVFAAGNDEALPGIVHEFGHSFANLDDEYEGDAFSSKEVVGSKCIMRTLDEHQFCRKCQAKIKKAIDYWSE